MHIGVVVIDDIGDAGRGKSRAGHPQWTCDELMPGFSTRTTPSNTTLHAAAMVSTIVPPKVSMHDE